MNREEIVKLLDESGLEAYREAIASWIFPSYQLHLRPSQEEDLPAGSSKVGGRPDLPTDVEWPMWKDYHQSFLAQINLADVPSASTLPASGLLSFFYAAEAMIEDPEFYGDPHTCRVIYTTPGQLDGNTRRDTGRAWGGIRPETESCGIRPDALRPPVGVRHLGEPGSRLEQQQERF